MDKISDTDYAKYLSSERFNYSRLKTLDLIKKLKENNFSDLDLLNQIENEDLLLKVNLRTYNRCKIQLVVSFLAIVIGYFLREVNHLFFIVIIIATYFFISSFFGMRTNRISNLEKQYITNKNTQHI